MDRKQVAVALQQMSVLLELAGANPFKSRAFSNGAHALDTLDEDLDVLVREKRLLEVDGIGKTIARAIEQLVDAGTFDDFERLKDEIPEGLLEVRRLPGLGSKKVRLLWEKLGITGIDDLERAAEEGKLADLPGFGPKSTGNVLEAIARRRERSGRSLWPAAHAVAMRFEEALGVLDEVQRFSLAGSLRRRIETVHDVDLLVAVAPEDRDEVMRAFTEHETVDRVLARGETKSSVTTGDGVQVDLRAVSVDEFPYALHHFTGSKEHNTAMRGRAKARGLKMSEWGVFEGERRLPAADEAEVFGLLGLPFIPPELRENGGEIEAAEADELPRLVECEDLRGVLHVHTSESDGRDSLEAMVLAARDRGWKWVGITDHSQSAIYANGLDASRLRAQAREIDALRAGVEGIEIFHGVESDILEDGSLDYDDEVLAELDFVVASIHSRLGLSREAMTERVLTALRHPAVSVLGHPTGRLLLDRDPYEIDVERVLLEAARLGVAVELNATPRRIDLDWRHCRRARTEGVLVAIGPDAHRVEGYDVVPLGVAAARKAWLEKKHVLNCHTAKQARTFFERRRRDWKPEAGRRSRHDENGELL